MKHSRLPFFKIGPFGVNKVKFLQQATQRFDGEGTRDNGMDLFIYVLHPSSLVRSHQSSFKLEAAFQMTEASFEVIEGNCVCASNGSKASTVHLLLEVIICYIAICSALR